MNRRSILIGALAAVPLAACGIISSNKSNGVTTITISVTDVQNWGAAIANAAKLLSVLPGIPASTAAVVSAVETKVLADLTAFTTAAGSSLTLTFDSTSVPAAINSLLSDGQSILSAVTGVGIPASFTSAAQQYIDALSTIVSVFKALISSTTKVAATPMTEGHALSILGVK